MDSLSLPLITFQAVSLKQRTAWVYISFFQKCHPLLYQKTRCRSIFRINIKVIIPHFGGGRSVDNLISRYVGWRDVAQFPFQVSFPGCRMTKCQRCHPQYVWSRDVINQNVCFLQTISSNTFQNFPMSIQDFVFLSFIFIILSTR